LANESSKFIVIKLRKDKITIVGFLTGIINYKNNGKSSNLDLESSEAGS
jgi:hypothetical protein